MSIEVAHHREVGYVRLRDAIRTDIVGGRFHPGARLKIPELCQLYGVSAIPVREALQRLQGEGLVTMVPNRGAVVRAVDETFIRNIYDIREAIDRLVARRFVERATADDLQALEEAQAELERREAAGDLQGRHEADRRFHRVIVRACDNEEAMLILERQNNIINALRLEFGQSAVRRAQVRDEHLALLRAFRDGNAAAAERLAATHARHAGNDLVAHWRKSNSPPRLPSTHRGRGG